MSAKTLVWEIVTAGGDLQRVRVPGGWIYRCEYLTSPPYAGVAVAMVFVPDWQQDLEDEL